MNAIGTLYVLEAARACPHPPRVLLTSSAEVYGAVPARAPARHRGRPARAGDALRGVARWRPSTSGSRPTSPTACRCCACAPSTTWARASRRRSSCPPWPQRIVEARRSGADSIVVGNLAARRDLTDVRDVVRAYRLLAERGVAGEVYNVCSGRDVAIADVAEQLQSLAGVELQLRARPGAVAARRRPRGARRLRPSCARRPDGSRASASSDTLRDVLEQWSDRAA